MDEKLSRRKVLSFSLLGAVFGLLAPTVLAVSDVEAQTPRPTSAAPAPPRPETGPERRQKRRAGRQERREERSATLRGERQPTNTMHYMRERHDPHITP